MLRAKVVGEKVYLRPLEVDDIDGGWLDWINDYEVSRGLLSPLPLNRAALEKYLARSSESDCTIFAVCDKENDAFIGTTRLSSIDWVNRVAAYGGIIGPESYRGSGYGTDMLLQILRYGFHYLGLNRIWSAAWVENEISVASNDKLGMKREGILRQHVFKQGRFHDCIVLGMLRSEFDELHGSPAEWAARSE